VKGDSISWRCVPAAAGYPPGVEGLDGAGERSRISLARIEEAAAVVDPVFLHSPQVRVERHAVDLGCELFVKVETVNPIRSFKGRGADFFLRSIDLGERLVCASAGNFGQAMAYACRRRGMPLVVFASVNANELKIEAMRRLGADVRLAGHDFDAAKDAARAFATAAGARMVEDGLEPAISEGAGTIAVELLTQPEPLEAIVIPLGNGALLGGVARWTKAVSPSTEVIAVQAAGAPAMERSWRLGSVVELPAQTVADGIAVRVPIPEAVGDMYGRVDDVLLVDDDAIVEAMRLCHRRLGLVVEPAGAVGLAAVAAHRRRFADRRVATILCGGNMTAEQIGRWLG
jgi:threonine dehydratase